jgi:uncharacterized membrane protein (UPF0127 family)
MVSIRIRNRTINARVASSFLDSAKGLSFSKKENLLIELPSERRCEIWMFGMRYALQLIYIDKNCRVVDVKFAEPMTLDPRTWKLYVPRKKCKYVLELPVSIDVKVGSKLAITN